MDREKILKKARAEGRDEGLDYAKNKGLSLGYKIFCALIVVFIIFNFFMGKQNYELFSLLWGFIGAEAYSRYKFSKKKVEFISVIGASIACIVFLINYFLYSFR